MSDVLAGSRVLLGVTGSIAAYKAAEIARLLGKRGAVVQVAMTEAASKFVGATTFHALTGRGVLTDVFELGASAALAFGGGGEPAGEGRRSEIEHVEQAHSIDLAIVAPATANAIARFACGLADDVLSAIVLATRAPLLIAPAMEPGMWENAATRDNVERLRARGVAFVGPADGELASGRSGVGRMAEPEAIVAAAARVLAPRDLAGLGVVITAGPTWEAIDPVRVLSNRSTGAMGIAIARRAAERGAKVTLILGPTTLAPPNGDGIEVVRVESAADMLEAGRGALALSRANVLIASAAVSDFRPESAHASKLKRGHAGARTIALAENPDVLATLAAEMRGRVSAAAPVIVGFAAETEDVERHAREKLAKKGCDLVIANLVGPKKGFGSGESEVLAVRAKGASVRFGPALKEEIAQFVLDQVVAVGKQGQSG